MSSEKNKTILYGGISKTPEERAEILYNHPDNERKEKIIERHIIEYIPVEERECMPNMFKSNLGIMPVEYTEAPQKTYSRDLKQERRDRVNEIRAQKRINSFEKSKNPKERMDYINNSIKSSAAFPEMNNSVHFEISVKPAKKSTIDKDYQKIAEMFYSDMNLEESQIKTNRDKEYYNSVQIQKYENTENREIFDVEKTLFPNGMMGEMPLQPIKEEEKSARNNKTKRDNEEIANVLYPNIPENAEIMKLKEVAKAEVRKIEKERWLTHAKNFGGTALIIGSAAIPLVTGPKIAVGLTKTITPMIGKKIAQEVSTGIIDGAISGGVYGLGEGLLNDKNPVLSSLEGIVIGGATGGTIGLGTGKYLQSKRIQQLNDLTDKRADWGIVYRQFSGKPEEAIDFLIKEQKGFVPAAINKKGIGNIDFVWGDSTRGLKHIIERRNSEGYDGIAFVKKIPSIIRNGKVVEKEGHIGRKYIVDDTYETVIRLDWNQKERKWLITTYVKK